MSDTKPEGLPPQHQTHQPGSEQEMHPRPRSAPAGQPGRRLAGKVALITGGDSGIGRAVALAYAREGAKLAIVYLDEEEDARLTQKDIQALDAPCLLIPGDVGSPEFCRSAVRSVMDAYGRLDVLVNNAAQQYPAQSIEQISAEQLEHTFRTNIFSMFYLVKEAMPFLTRGARIINTTSVTAYRGSKHLVDYAATKGAIVAFTRSLSQQLAPAGIHVNAVAPGPIWTPLIPASFSEEEVASFGKNVPLGRPGQPDEVAPAYVFLATEGASYMTGQVLHPNGGEIVNT
ncbi:SDR family oxidoreductase [Herbaspirillum huttiense]|uniref:SDR family oxidoreductase n=1 Tax=Herbaspirillum huttiense TaxID=863372 RepID=UPI001AC3AAC0|nr:SDR family oxidoreductase [Herbaspirillum huttiense]MBN9357816.1 SDR family oxidoreductase [Herbaspirillum huttiense]